MASAELRSSSVVSKSAKEGMITGSAVTMNAKQPQLFEKAAQAVFLLEEGKILQVLLKNEDTYVLHLLS